VELVELPLKYEKDLRIGEFGIVSSQSRIARISLCSPDCVNKFSFSMPVL